MSHSMKNLAFHGLLRWMMTTNSHYLTYTHNFFLKAWRMLFLVLGVRGLIHFTAVSRVFLLGIFVVLTLSLPPCLLFESCVFVVPLFFGIFLLVCLTLLLVVTFFPCGCCIELILESVGVDGCFSDVCCATRRSALACLFFPRKSSILFLVLLRVPVPPAGLSSRPEYSWLLKEICWKSWSRLCNCWLQLVSSFPRWVHSVFSSESWDGPGNSFIISASESSDISSV